MSRDAGNPTDEPLVPLVMVLARPPVWSPRQTGGRWRATYVRRAATVAMVTTVLMILAPGEVGAAAADHDVRSAM